MPIEHEPSADQNPVRAYYQFGEFQFHPELDQLSDITNQNAEKLEPQVAQLLMLFVSHQGDVISKEQLTQTLWPNTIVEQNSLYQLLTKLRKLLKDSSRNPTYIKTLPKKGYCFICPVDVVSQESKKAEDNITHSASSIAHSQRYFLMLSAIIVLSMIGYLFTPSHTKKTPHYALQDISYQLGLESDISAHLQHDLMVYVKDLYHLHITNKQGEIKHQLNAPSRIGMPNWHPHKTQLAYWQYQENRCLLKVISAKGELIHQAPAIQCENSLSPVWKNDQTLIVSLKQQGQLVPYAYHITSKKYQKVTLSQPTQSEYKGALIAWHNHVYYLLNHADHTSSLIKDDGEIALSWDYPVWLVAYNPNTQAIVSNDQSQRHRLIATHKNGQHYPIYSTANGIFTSVSIDNRGDIYSAIENWQVNIRDKNNALIFSTSSIDYLPVSNTLGETAFMSRRSGVCEVYLHANDQITRLSQHKGYEFVEFLEWRPDLSMLLSNRDMDLAVYDREQLILQFTTSLNHTIKNTGWYDNQTLFAFDGRELQFYDLAGKIQGSHPINAQFMYFDHHNRHWLVLKDNVLYQQASIDSVPVARTILSAKQTNLLHNIRVKNNTLYWQSAWSKEDYIWRLSLKGSEPAQLVKQGHLIWHFDISANEALTIAKMEAIEGDIKRLHVTENK